MRNTRERGRRRCSACEETKPLTHEHWHRRGDSYIYECRPCRNAYARDLYRTNESIRRKAIAGSQRRWGRQRERMERDPEYAEEMRRRGREAWARYKARKQGAGDRTVTPRGPRVDLEPFAEWCRRQTALRDGNADRTAEALGVDEAQLRRWRNSQSGAADGSIGAYRVDEVLTHEGGTALIELYPELFDE